MRARVFLSRGHVFLGLLLVTATGAGAAALEIASPFLPASGPPANTVVTTGAPIELHGYMMTSEGEKFSIYDSAKKSATWVKVNEKGYPFVVRSYKVENSTDQITVDYQGSTLTLALKQSKIAPATQPVGPAQAFAGRVNNGFAAGGPGGPGRGGPPQAAAVPVVPTAEEATRLQAAAIDFQQRQAQRQQAQAALQAAQVVQPVAPAAQAGQRSPRGQQQNGQQQNNGATRRAQRGQ